MRQEAYRVAFGEANWELKEIVGQFDSLAARKDHIQKVVDVLKPLVGFGGQIPGADPRGAELTTDIYPQKDASRGFASGPTRGIRLEAYRVAFEEASTELKEFLQKFDQLRYRKEYLERVVDVLRPLVSQGASVAVMEPRAAESETALAGEPAPVPAAAEAVATEAPVQEEASDPFARRDAAGSSAPTKDLRDYSRLFSSLQRR